MIELILFSIIASFVTLTNQQTQTITVKAVENTKLGILCPAGSFIFIRAAWYGKDSNDPKCLDDHHDNHDPASTCTCNQVIVPLRSY